MARRTRRQFTAQQKLAFVQKHLVDKQPVSQVCNENDLFPTQLYEWIKQFEANAHAAFVAPQQISSRERQLEEKIAALEAKIVKKDEIIAWVAEEQVTLKKSLGLT